MLGLVLGLVALAVPATASASVAPNATNDLDCNGWSASYGSARPAMKELCTDPIAVLNGKATRFIDNGWYVGHDEPSVKFISSQPGSGNRMTYVMQLPVDPAKPPTASGSVTDYGELSIAPWFGLPLCDPHSYPQNSCTPDSDSNSGSISDPGAAGSAFMELQFYPPGFTPFIDSASCSPTRWCSALTIDSLECTFGFATCNGNCEEPVNFAYIQHDGNPTGPPSPQLTDVSTFTPNRETLMMNGGDLLVVSISDPPGGFTTRVTDLTTGQSGVMVASAKNGFMNTNIADCTGNPFTFHAEYNTAKQQNQVPWAALEGGVLMEQEIGHGETCNSVTNQDPFDMTYPGGQSYSDPNVFDTCVGGAEGSPTAIGEGPCSGVICQNATTQGPTGPVACPTNNAASGALCEFADGFCFAAGTRTVQINGVPATESSRVDICYNNRFQNGDLDFDGTAYVPDWPDGSPNHPTSINYIGPFTGGRTYPQVQFETDIGGSSNLCNVATGAGCTVPPISAKFYPFWTLGSAQDSRSDGLSSSGSYGSSLCVWNFGNSLPNTKADFGKDAQYGTPDVARYGGTIISAPLPNPQLNTRCGSRRY
ncbi:MAG: hypothetical protein JO130_06260 [Solirubrobacterales bacterium]|nr:hypothetical protein [Solirubrobacterales bacterium]